MPFSEHFSMAKATKAISGGALPAAAIDDTAGPMTVPGPPVPSISGDVNDILAIGMTKLRQHDPDAWEYFAAVAYKHEVREAWLGLAVAHQFRDEPKLAGHALARAFSRHAITNAPQLADAIAASVSAPGWCALDGAGILTVRLTHALPGGSPPTARLDGKPLRLRANPDTRTFTARLPTGWHRASEIAVTAGDAGLIGSPIAIKAIVRVEGFVDSDDGDLHGWAWCPNDPDRDPILSVVPIDGGSGLTVIADDHTVIIATRTPLARPRGFRISAEKLRFITGPVRVGGLDGRNLTGSPLDPSAERSSAEATSRVVAGLFPAPGDTTANTQPGRLQSAPAHLTGGPVLGGSKRRPVDVVVPVYGGLDHTMACLESVLADLPRWARVVVVDDASPDPRVVQKLAELAARRRIVLLPQPMNRGFPATANVGMRHDAARDVVLLNSDTLVPPGWLGRLRDAAYAAPDIGSVTPFSNDATILSYPSVEHINPVPDLQQVASLDALAEKANAGHLVDIPTAIGFCTYIKRDCLNATGLLREDVFAQGYGEENDFCIRSRHLGWRHVALPSLFVGHVGGQSFGSAKHYLIERNMRMLNRLHPGYDALIAAFQSIDPMADSRRRLDQERWKTFRSRRKSVLLVTHGRAGGVQRHVAERAALLRAEGLRPIVLWPVASRDGIGRDCVLGNGPEGGTPNLRFAIPGELDLLTRTLKADNPVRAEIHHLIGHDHQLLDLFQRLAVPYEMVIHDYSWLCPRINLVGPGRRYCGEPNLDGCEACILDGGTLNDETVSTGALRERSARELAGASRIVVPSRDVATRLRRYFPQVRPSVTNWEDDGALPPPELPPLSPDGIRRVCIVGAIGIEKGYDVLLACARDAADRKLALRFHLVGHSCDDGRLLATGTVHITGRYEEHEAVDLIRRQQAQLAWLTSIWPETWCYTLTQAWRAGLNVLAFDIGTPADRIRHTGRGRLCPLGLSPQAINRLLMENTTNLEVAA
jgi:GT2 family glycosyltransferase/glycosyltransferase involved in cell wall biosynthesis